MLSGLLDIADGIGDVLRVEAAAEAPMAACHVTAPDSMVIELTSPGYSISQTEGVHRLSADGMGSGGPAGHPELPGKLLRFALPPETDLGSVSVELISATVETVPGTGYSLSLGPLYASSEGILPEAWETAAAWDPASYGSGEYYGQEAWSFVSAQQGGRWKVLEVEYTPFAYQPLSGELTVAKDVKLAVSFQTDEPLPPGWASNRGTDEHIAEMVENFDAALPLYEAAAAAEADTFDLDPAAAGIGEDIAIITTSAIHWGSYGESSGSNLEDYVAHKRSRGYDVFVWNEHDWGGGTVDTAANNIRSFLRGKYGSHGLDYVILIGNPDPEEDTSPQWVPMRTAEQGSRTDYYFADLDTDWDDDDPVPDGVYGEWVDDMKETKPIHEVQVGRIPCYGNYVELNSIFQKIIDYETEVETGWRNDMLTATAISNFANEDGNGWPQTLGWELATNIRDDLAIPEGYVSWEMWEREGLVYPTPAPDVYLTQDNFVAMWSAGSYAFVNYHGHGSPTHVARKIWDSDLNNDGVPNGIDLVVELETVAGSELNRFAAPEQLSGNDGLAYSGPSYFHSLFFLGQSGTLWQLNADTGEVIDSDPIWVGSGMYDGLAALENRVYILDAGNSDILVFDPVFDHIVQVLDIDGLNPGVVLAGGLAGISNPDALIATCGDGSVVEINPVSGLITNSFPAPRSYTGVAVVNGEIYLGDSSSPARVDVYSRAGVWQRYFSLPYPVSALGGVAPGPGRLFAAAPHDTEISAPAFFRSGDCATLDDDHPSFVTMAACSNGTPEEPDNLGYRTLVNGGIGVVAASTATVYMIGEWQDTWWETTGDNASYAYKITERMTDGGNEYSETMAEALQWCRENMGCTGPGTWRNCTAFNLYGDPTTTVGRVMPNLRGDYFSVVMPLLRPGDTTDIQYRIENTGNCDAADFTVRFYLSTNKTISTSDHRFGDYVALGSLAAGATTGTLGMTVTLPPADDSFWDGYGEQEYYIGMIVDADGDIAETSENDNKNRGDTFDYNMVLICDDRYEYNDTRGSAYDLSSKEHTWLSTVDGYARQGDSDWYKINADIVGSQHQRIQVDCTFTHSEGDINLRLWSSTGTTPLASSTSTTDNERIDAIVNKVGTYYIEVYNGNQSNVYDLWWDDLSDDAYEENDTKGTAYSPFPENKWLDTISDLGIQEDDDWYAIDVDPSGFQRVSVALQYAHLNGNIDLELYNFKGTLLTGSYSTTGDEAITDYVVPTTGTYYLRVYGANAGNTYNLWWDDLYDDNYEENDGLGAAYGPVSEGTWLDNIAGLGIQKDSDWYEIEVTPAGFEYVVAKLEFTHTDGNIDLSLYDSGGALLTSSTSTTDDELIEYVVPGVGTYYLRVYGAQDAGNTYNLWWDDLSDDKYEENDTQATAYYPGQNWEHIWLSSIAGKGRQRDADWYQIDVAPSGCERLIVDLQFTHADGNIDLEVYDSAGGLVTGSYSATDNESIDYLVPGAGTYYLKMFGDNAGNLYDLWWDDLSLSADFGDAPDGPYATLSTSNGPRHLLVEDLFMGATVDAEIEALPTAGARGDDTDNADDEDGLNNPVADLALTIGAQPTVNVIVTNNAGAGATLYGWIDYNHDGVFQNAGERAQVSVPDGTSGGIVTLAFPVVPAGFTGKTYSRFRLSTDAAAADPTGPASDGEVEDYAVLITRPGSGTVEAHQKISDTEGNFTGTLDDSDYFCYSMANVGDLDGDGVSDLAVGAYRDDDGGTDRGAVWMLFLNSDGTVKAHQKISDTEGNFTGAVDNGDFFGYSVANVGDLDGDGVTDLAVGARGDDDGGANRGAVWMLFLNSDGTVKARQKISDTEGNFAGTLDNSDAFGSSVTAVGDLDGDGVTDLAVGAYDDDDGGSDRGAVWMLFLNSDGTVKAHQKISDTEGDFTGVLDDNDLFGNSVASVGDLDGDGVSDLAVGANLDDDGGSDRGAVWMLFLDADGTVKAHQKISDTEGNFAGTLDSGDWLGTSVASIGDLDGDGVSDLAVGANRDDDGGGSRGAVWMLFLDTDGTVRAHQKISDTEGNFTGTLDNFDRFGHSVANLGDLNGDGRTDLAVGAPYDDDGGPERGSLWTLFLAPQPDFGDAPAPYPTLLANDGAHHILATGGPFMGAGLDADPDGQPDADALGDDLLDGSDDEDGVEFVTPLARGQTADVDIDMTASPSGALLNAWVDFNNDGDWDDDLEEQIFTDEPLTAGVVNHLSFPVPGSGPYGCTYARFRVSTTAGLSYKGGAPDGEVEDYAVLIPKPGDTDLDGDVDLDDLSALDDGWDPTATDKLWTEGDGDGDGDVDLDDLSLLDDHWAPAGYLLANCGGGGLLAAAGQVAASDETSAHDAAVEEVFEQEPSSRANSLGKWAWLYEFHQMHSQNRPSEKHNPAEEAVDKLHATYWP